MLELDELLGEVCLVVVVDDEDGGDCCSFWVGEFFFS